MSGHLRWIIGVAAGVGTIGVAASSSLLLLFDFRGHGESESVATSGGNAEIRDLEAALNVVRQQPETLPGKIIIHGFSMGASVALLTDPPSDVAAIVLDSPYARLDEILQSIMHWQLTRSSRSWKPFLHPLRYGFHTLTQATFVVSTVIFRMRFGHALNARPDTSFKRWQARSKGLTPKSYPPILLIHGMKDSSIPITHAHKIATQAQAHKTSPWKPTSLRMPTIVELTAMTRNNTFNYCDNSYRTI